MTIVISFITISWNFTSKSVKIIGFLLWLIQFLSYTYTFLINPGLPNKNCKIDNETTLPKLKNYRICTVCLKIMDLDENTNHCLECQVCIEGNFNYYFYQKGLDHHCPWTSKCVGKNNKFSFHVFVTSTLIFVMFFFFASITANL